MRWQPLILALVAGCFRPQIAEIDCSPEGTCPPQTICDIDNVCRDPANRISPDASVDANRGTGQGFAADHLPMLIDDFGELELVITGDVEIDTDTNRLGPPFNLELATIEQEGGGPSTAVLVVKRFEIAAGATVRVRGARPLIVAAGPLGAIIAGRIDAGGHGPAAGPGADNRGAGVVGASDGSFHAAGGGGSFLLVGGRGGDTESAAGGLGGNLANPQLLDVLLFGGAAGGGGAPGQPCERRGGGGGGALQISTPGPIDIEMGGLVVAGGGGGEPGGPCPSGRGGPGGGGGSGGFIHLQGQSITIGGAVIANGGGGGGGGGDDNGQDGEAGEDGDKIGVLASGGRGGDDSGNGGGGGRDEGAGPGGDSRTGNGGGGGGGGAAGRVSVRGDLTVATGGEISPAP